MIKGEDRLKDALVEFIEKNDFHKMGLYSCIMAVGSIASSVWDEMQETCPIEFVIDDLSDKKDKGD